MPSKITLKVLKGAMNLKGLAFEETTTCILGRGADCTHQLPDDALHQKVSRHHCLLDISPPDICVRDFGSLNGTYVNDEQIGKREKEMSAEEGAKLVFKERKLAHGDRLRVGDTVFSIDVWVPPQCEECSEEIQEMDKSLAERLPGLFRCDKCERMVKPEKRKDPPKKKAKLCVRCKKDVAHEMGENRRGDFVCASCQKDPFQILMGMLGKAKKEPGPLDKIRDYKIERELGKGGMGAVYLARKEGSKELVALKLMLPQVAADERSKKMFLREIENTKALKHPNVVEYRDSAAADGAFFLVLEYCALGSLDRLIAKQGTLLLGEALKLTYDVLDGLHYAHNATVPFVELMNGEMGSGRGLVHRDLSPHNILLKEVDGIKVAKVSDYGLAKAFDIAGLSGMTRTGPAGGKPWYMPRQQVINFKYSRPEVDVWAAAACLYVMLTQHVPRDFPKGKDVWKIVLETDALPIRKYSPEIPLRLAAVIDKALVDKPTLHFKTALEFQQALRGAV